MKLNG